MSETMSYCWQATEASIITQMSVWVTGRKHCGLTGVHLYIYSCFAAHWKNLLIMQHFAMQSSWTFTLDFPFYKKKNNNKKLKLKLTEEQVATKKTQG